MTNLLTMKTSIFRKIVAAGLLIFGIFLQVLAPESWIGLLVIGLAVAIEMIGIALTRHYGKERPYRSSASLSADIDERARHES
ncbi:MAG: hypothetical protein U0989_14300 [Azonexus sp.]|nr:hypothetical protein [Azonexus sp.]MDP3639486.1 hypothetical protein [Azonexus sp.]MDZ4315926.1 hypothetical protein [Azonexus sp.]